MTISSCTAARCGDQRRCWRLARPAGWMVLSVVMLAAACESQPARVSQYQLRIATGTKNGLNIQLGRALAEIYNARLPDVTASVFETSGSVANVLAVEQGRAEMGFAQGDVAYSAFLGGSTEYSEPHGRLRAIANIYANALHVVVLRDSGITRVRDLDGWGKIGAPDAGTNAAARLVLQGYGLDKQIVPVRPDVPQALAQLSSGEADAALVVVRSPNPLVAELNHTHGIRLLGLEPAVVDQLRAHYPFFWRVSLPEHAYEGQEGAVATVGINTILVCRSDLADDLVSQLTRLAIESAPALARVNPAVVLDAAEAFSAPIPLHPGATRLYRERELFR